MGKLPSMEEPVAQSINRLTAGHVSKITIPGKYPDGGGLLLRIAAGGSKQWQFRFRKSGRERYMGLGSTRTVSLAEARAHALDARKLLLEGRDPIEERNKVKRDVLISQTPSVTFAEAFKQYLTAHSSSWKNEKHRWQWQQTIEAHALPKIGELAVQDVDTAAVRKVLEPIWCTTTETATRVRQRIEKILDWATVRGYRDGSNPARWRGHLETQLPRMPKSERVKHFAALPYDQIPIFMAKLRGREALSALALEFLILTAARTGEVINARWSEIDFGRAIWTIPANRMKARREHIVPLSERAAEIVLCLKELTSGGEMVFVTMSGGQMSGEAMRRLLERMGRSDITVHGFRSTFRDWAGDCTSHAREVAEGCLAHTVKGVEAAYRRSDALEKRRLLLTDWSNYCSPPIAADISELIPLKEGAVSA